MINNNLEDNRLTICGRLVFGSPHRVEDAKFVKEGHAPKYHIHIAVKKGAEKSFLETTWGQALLKCAMKSFPQYVRNGAFNPPASFSWKVIDGDDTTPNKNNKAPCDLPGYKGNWVVKTSTKYKPHLFNSTQGVPNAPLDDNSGALDIIYRGSYVAVRLQYSGNTLPKDNSVSPSSSTPGLYLSPVMVNLIGHMERLVSFFVEAPEDAFGDLPTVLPEGVSTTPVHVEPTDAVVTPMPPVASVPVVPHPAILDAHTGIESNPTYIALKSQGLTHEQIMASGVVK